MNKALFSSTQDHILLGEEFLAECHQNPPLQMLHAKHGIESSIHARFPLPNGRHCTIFIGERQPYGFTEQDWEMLDRTAPQLALAWVSLQSRIELERFRDLLAADGKDGMEAEAIAQTRINTQESSALLLHENSNPQELLPGVIGTSTVLRAVVNAVKQVAPTGATVLLEGETGTGKERIARSIHALSERATKPFIALNCAALPANLIESELFGHEKGAFTGATERRIGKFEQAEGGTIFLDEIGEMPLDVQAKLLRTLQERELERVGGKETIRLNVRVIAATNRSLAEESAKGRFRADLYYRLNVFPIAIPPLRERLEDIPLLVWHFVGRASERIGKAFISIEAASMQALMRHSWQGNIRELENILERAAILSSPPVLKIAGIISNEATSRQNSSEFGAISHNSNAAEVQSLEDAEREHILRALTETNWRVSGEKGAATLLKMKPTTLEYRMKKLGIVRKGNETARSMTNKS